MNEVTTKRLPDYLPYAVGTLFVLLFAALGAWQIERGLQKRAMQADFDTQTSYASWFDGMDVRSFQKLRATGMFDTDRQFLLENIIVNSRYGYYVITPLVGLTGEPVLLVNRGWIEKTGESLNLDVPEGRLTVRGRAGSLPRAGAGRRRARRGW